MNISIFSLKNTKIVLTAAVLFFGHRVNILLAQTGLTNPLGSKAGTVREFIQLIISTLIPLITPFIIIFIVYAGFLFVTAQGNDEKLKKAKQVLLYTVIGTAVLLGAEMFSLILQDTFTDINQ